MFQSQTRARAQFLLGLVGILLLAPGVHAMNSGAPRNDTHHTHVAEQRMRKQAIHVNNTRKLNAIKARAAKIPKPKEVSAEFQEVLYLNAKDADELVQEKIINYFSISNKSLVLAGLVGFTDALNKVFRQGEDPTVPKDIPVEKGDNVKLSESQANVIKTLYSWIFGGKILTWLHSMQDTPQKLSCFHYLYQLLNLTNNYKTQNGERFTEWLNENVLNYYLESPGKHFVSSISVDLVYGGVNHDLNGTLATQFSNNLKSAKLLAWQVINKSTNLPKSWHSARPTNAQYAKKFAHLGRWDYEKDSYVKDGLRLAKKLFTSAITRSKIDSRYDSLLKELNEINLPGRRRLMDRLNAECPPQRN